LADARFRAFGHFERSLARSRRCAAGLATVLADLLTPPEEQLDARTGRLEIITGASHLFEEPGALEQVARLAQGWFTQHLKPGPRLLQLVLPG
jgi:hypothetical protein